MKLTPQTYESVNNNWQEKRDNNSSKTIYSSSVLQKQISDGFDSTYFRYTACPICREDKFTDLHTRTPYATKRWQDFILNLLVLCIGKKSLSAILSLFMRRSVDFTRRGYRVVQCISCNFI